MCPDTTRKRSGFRGKIILIQQNGLDKKAKEEILKAGASLAEGEDRRRKRHSEALWIEKKE